VTSSHRPDFRVGYRFGQDGCVLEPKARRISALFGAVLVFIAILAGPPAPSRAQPRGVAEPTVGPLFLAGLGQPHNCSASVVSSASRDLVLTAAHCITGSGAGVQFVPGYRGGSTPYGVWTAAQVYVDPSWLARQDEQHDVAILKMRRQQRNGHWVGVQDVVGAGNLLGVQALPGTRVRVPAYPTGLNDQPISCRSPVYQSQGYSGFDCPGYLGGTSGAPFLLPLRWKWLPGGHRSDIVVGVIGGLHQGGCVPETSYSSAFGPAVYQLWLRATAGLTPDILPSPGGSGC
jgi:Trypsin-like peptidase domain